MNNNPNVLLIHLDQLRWDCLSIYGNRQIKTPNIDLLSRHSTVYDNHFCSYPVCTPSRYSLLSGLDVQDHKGWDNRCTLKDDIQTWPKLLRQNAYRTTAVGKMHFTPTYLDVGFDEMILCEQDGQGRWDDDYHKDLMSKGKIDLLDIMDQRSEYREKADDSYWSTFGTKENNLEAELASSGWIAQKAIEKLENWNVHSECLMVGFVKPHHPFDPPAPWSTMYNPSDMEILDGWTESCLPRDLDYDKGYFDNRSLNKEALKTVQAAYYGCISEIDSYIGKFVQILKKKEIYDNTTIILTSDHGSYVGYHHLLLKSNHMYDPLMRIPLCIKSVNQKKPLKNSILSSNDIIASEILKECNIRHKSFNKSLNHKNQYVFAHSNNGKMTMVRSENYKLLWNNDNKIPLFFDLKNDDNEIHDLSNNKDLQGIIKEHINALHSWQGKDFHGNQIAYLNETIDTADKDRRESTIEYYKNIFERTNNK
ncbi:MAG: sulfatase-like hydrolase/transferase [Spirochaetaceae bacterium]